jgi:phosphotriesterase-related protein
MCREQPPRPGRPSRRQAAPHTAWCWRGRAPAVPASAMADWQPTHVFKKIIPRLRAAGVPQAKIDLMLVENQRRYFDDASSARC